MSETSQNPHVRGTTRKSHKKSKYRDSYHQAADDDGYKINEAARNSYYPKDKNLNSPIKKLSKQVSFYLSNSVQQIKLNSHVESQANSTLSVKKYFSSHSKSDSYKENFHPVNSLEPKNAKILPPLDSDENFLNYTVNSNFQGFEQIETEISDRDSEEIQQIQNMNSQNFSQNIYENIPKSFSKFGHNVAKTDQEIIHETYDQYYQNILNQTRYETPGSTRNQRLENEQHRLLKDRSNTENTINSLISSHNSNKIVKFGGSKTSSNPKIPSRRAGQANFNHYPSSRISMYTFSSDQFLSQRHQQDAQAMLEENQIYDDEIRKAWKIEFNPYHNDGSIFFVLATIFGIITVITAVVGFIFWIDLLIYFSIFLLMFDLLLLLFWYTLNLEVKVLDENKHTGFYTVAERPECLGGKRQDNINIRPKFKIESSQLPDLDENPENNSLILNKNDVRTYV